MGLLPCPCPCPFPCQYHSDDTNYHHQLHLHSESSSTSSLSSSSSTSLSSQCSLPSVPSLTPQPSSSSLPQPNYHHRCVSTLKGHSSYVSSLSLAGKTLFSSSSDGEIRSWTETNPSEQTTLAASAGSAVKSVVFLGDNKLITAHQDHKIRVWKVEEKNKCCKLLITLPKLTDQLTKMFSAKNYVEVRRHKRCTWVHHADAVSALALSRDGALLFSVSWDRTLKVWRTADFKCLESVEKAHDDAVNAVVAGPGGVVYTGSADTRIRVWRRGDGERRYCLAASLEKHKSAVNALALSEDGATLYSGACDRSVLVWEEDKEARGQMVVVGALRGHSKAVLCLVAVGDLVCSGSADNTVRVWRRGLGRSYSCVAVLEGHARPVKCVAAAAAAAVSGGGDGGSGNSYVVYSGGLDCSIKVWHVRI